MYLLNDPITTILWISSSVMDQYHGWCLLRSSRSTFEARLSLWVSLSCGQPTLHWRTARPPWGKEPWATMVPCGSSLPCQWWAWPLSALWCQVLAWKISFMAKDAEESRISISETKDKSPEEIAKHFKSGEYSSVHDNNNIRSSTIEVAHLDTVWLLWNWPDSWLNTELLSLHLKNTYRTDKSL